jgi:hypothetical protein
MTVVIVSAGGVTARVTYGCDIDTQVTTFANSVFVYDFSQPPSLKAEEYPLLAAIWDNAADAIFDEV